MSSGAYVRRFDFEPDAATLVNIESINIIDKDQPPVVLGVGFGRAALVGEFENGPFATPTLILSPTDQTGIFGSFGYPLNGLQGFDPSAVSRKADSAIVAEFWNGNASVQLAGKHFLELVLVRVDTSVGSVQLTRAASVSTGVNKPRFSLTSGQTIVLNYGGADDTATFTGVAATVTGAAAAFGAIVAGDTITLGYDAAANFVVTFLAGDTTVGNVIARINAYAGFTFASNNAGQVQLTGRIAGTSGQVRVVARTNANTGLSIANTAGTGNVANIAAVTPAEVKTIIEAASPKATVELLASGLIRIYNDTDGGAGTIQVKNTSTALDFAFSNAIFSAATGTAGKIPAGTVVRVPAGQRFVLMQDVNVTAASAGPYTVKIRHATDDGTGTVANVATVTLVDTPATFDSYTCTNIVPTSAALTEAQLDAQYAVAIATTVDINGPSKKINVIFAARQSNAVRRALKDNARTCSSNGLFGRGACARTPMGTDKSLATSTTLEPGVGIYRDERFWYCWPQSRAKVPEMVQRGTAGGAGFTADGVVDVGSDGFLASSVSMLQAGENPAQDAGLLSGALGLESSAVATGLTMQDYINLKAAGIVAMRFDDGQPVFQSGVTSVDPAVNPNRTSIERRTLADFIEDTLAQFYKAYSKKKLTVARQTALVDGTKGFMESLKGDFDGAGQRVDDYSLSLKANTKALRAAGRFRIDLKAVQTPSLLSIELAATVGPNVTIDEGT